MRYINRSFITYLFTYFQSPLPLAKMNWEQWHGSVAYKILQEWNPHFLVIFQTVHKILIILFRYWQPGWRETKGRNKQMKM